MILSIVIILLIAAVAYFHYLQGLFSAALSAIIAIVAAALAVGWHEALCAALLGGKYANQAYAITLVCLFAAIYLVLRLAFDKLVPGNVRFPLLVDKIGAPVMGVIAGMIVTGICALAAQMLPFGPSIGGYARFAVLAPRNVAVPVGGRLQDRTVVRIDADAFHEARSSGLAIPVDDFVLGLASRLSSPTGALWYGRPWSSIHPDYLRELYGQRVGIEIGATRAMMADHLKKADVYVARPTSQTDPESAFWRKPDADPLKPIAFAPDQLCLVVRSEFDRAAADENNNFVRLSTGAVRLVLRERNFFPVGVMDGLDKLSLQAPDDPLFLDVEKGPRSADFAFVVALDDLQVAGPGRYKLPAGTLFEAKRLARIDLSGRDVRPIVPAGELDGIVRRAPVKSPDGPPRPPPPDGKGSTPPPAVPVFSVQSVAMGPAHFGTIAVKTADREALVDLKSGSVVLRGGQIQSISLQPEQTARDLATGSNPVNQLYVPPGRQLLWVALQPDAQAGWGWAANLGQFQLALGDRSRHMPWGLRVLVDGDATNGKVLFRYDAGEKFAGRIEPVPSGRPAQVWLIFMVPRGALVESLWYEGKQLSTINQPAN